MLNTSIEEKTTYGTEPLMYAELRKLGIYPNPWAYTIWLLHVYA